MEDHNVQAEVRLLGIDPFAVGLLASELEKDVCRVTLLEDGIEGTAKAGTEMAVLRIYVFPGNDPELWIQ